MEAEQDPALPLVGFVFGSPAQLAGDAAVVVGADVVGAVVGADVVGAGVLAVQTTLDTALNAPLEPHVRTKDPEVRVKPLLHAIEHV